MLRNLPRLLVVLLIAALSFGAPLPAQADCDHCLDCSSEAPVEDSGCRQQGLACQLTQSCSGQMQTLSAPAGALFDGGIDGPSFAPRAAALKTALIAPETAPPRL